MFKNKFAAKLSLYFAIALLVFAVIISCIFFALLKNHAVNLNKGQLTARAESIAGALSCYMGENVTTNKCSNCGGYGAYFQSIGDIAGTDVWVVDENRNLVTSGMHHGKNSGRHSYNYSELPENVGNLIDEVFEDKTVIGEQFSGLFAESTVTVGTPVKSSDGSVTGVVLLHSPVAGVDEAVAEGVKLLLISLGAALFAVFLLSLWLSKNFTDPIIVKEAQDALRLEAVRREFVANISHELKTPITVIRGSLEALVDKIVSDPAQVEEYHRQMLHEATFLQRLVGDLLDLSKLQNTDFVIEKQDISVCDILEDVVRSVGPMAEKKGVRFNINKAGAVCSLNGDYGRVRQMLMIILDNAIKFSPENGVVDIFWDDKALIIRDHGVGIPNDELPFIFDRFYKSRSEQNKMGTGLGLAIAKQIADRHGIKISARNNENYGAAFTLQMPKKT